MLYFWICQSPHVFEKSFPGLVHFCSKLITKHFTQGPEHSIFYKLRIYNINRWFNTYHIIDIYLQCSVLFVFLEIYKLLSEFLLLLWGIQHSESYLQPCLVISWKWNIDLLGLQLVLIENNDSTVPTEVLFQLSYANKIIRIYVASHKETNLL